MPARPILWDIYEEHFDEAAFLWGAWEDALVGPNYVLQEVVDGPEERLRAHLDGLVLGGPRVAERLLLPALADDDPGKVFAAAWSLLQAEDAEHFPAVSAALPICPPAARLGIARAFELAERGDLAEKLRPLWDRSDPFVRSVILDTLASRDARWTVDHLPESLASQDPALLAAALRAVRRMPDVSFTHDVDRALGHTHPTVRKESLATAFLLRMGIVWTACRREAEANGAAAWLALALLAFEKSDAPLAELELFLAKPETRRPAVWALGFAGTVAAADRLVALLSDEELGRLAGEALSAITGVVIAGNLSLPGQTKGPDVEEVGPDDPPPEVRPEDFLLLPNPKTLAKWWKERRGQFTEQTSYVYGHVRAPQSLRSALAEGTMWRRPVWALKLGASGRAAVAVDVGGWGKGARPTSDR